MTRYRKYKNPYKIDFNRLSIYGNLKSRDSSGLELGSEITVKISDMDMEGRGVVKFKGYTIIVPRAVPGEKVTIRITKVENNKVAYASVVKRIEEPKR
ncbi:MAG: TRAM domain-containing protein [Desulfurococcales archaeon]|nr:TRAM domain-containing protein [Desulfurococcales archaeon]